MYIFSLGRGWHERRERGEGGQPLRPQHRPPSLPAPAQQAHAPHRDVTFRTFF